MVLAGGEVMVAKVGKEEAHLGMRVLFGEERVAAVVDGISWDWVGIRLDQGGYVIADWNDVYREEED